MRLLSSLVGVAIVAVAAVLLTLFALENTQVVSLSFLGSHFSGNIWWLVLGAAAIGFLLALLLVIPGRMATSYRASRLSQVNAEHEHDLAQLRDAHAQIQAQRDRLTTEHARVGNEMHTLRDELATARGDRDVARQERGEVRGERDQLREELAQVRVERERLVAERDQLRERLAASPAVAPVNADGYRPTVEPAMMGAVAPEMVAGQAAATGEDQVMASRVQEPTAGEPVMPDAVSAALGEDQVVSGGATEEPEMPPVQPVQAEAPAGEDQVMAHEPVATQPAQPSLGERVRAMVTGQPVDEVQAQDGRQDREQDARGEMPSGEPIMPPAAPIAAQPTDDGVADEQPATDQVSDAMAAGPSDQAVVPALAQTSPAAAATQTTGAGEQTPMVGDEAQPSEAQPSEAQPSEAQPSEAQPSEAQPSEAQPSEAQPSEAQPSEAQPSEAHIQDDVQDHEQPTLGERLRALFHAPEGEEAPPEQAAPQSEQPLA